MPSDEKRGSRGGAIGMQSGDRVIYCIDGRHGVAEEFLQDGDAFIRFDDGDTATVKWNNLSPELNDIPISQINFEELKIGDSVLSAVGNIGKIIGLFPEGHSGGRYARYDEIDFEWDHGGKSLFVFHCSCHRVIYLGRVEKV